MMVSLRPVLFAMLRQLGLLFEIFTANIALEGLHSRMNPQMINEITFLCEWLFALSADKN